MKFLLKVMLGKLGITPQDLKNFLFQRDDVDEAYLVAEYYNGIEARVMIDVGFAWGQASMPFLCRNWRVIGFEPDLSTSKAAAIKSARRHFKNLKIDDRAVSNVGGEVLTFYASKESEGISSLHAFRDHEFSHQVKTTTLSEIMSENDLSEVAFLKIDTEGHDLFVLQGLDSDQPQPEIILTEFEDSKTRPLGYSFEDIGDKLVDLGYQVYMFGWHPIGRYGQRHKFRNFSKYPSLLVDKNGWGNLVAVSAETANEFEKFSKPTGTKSTEENLR